MDTRKKYHINVENIIFDSLKYIFLILVFILTLYPFLNMLAYAFNDGLDAIKGRIYIWPRVFSMTNFQFLLSDVRLLIGARNSVIRTIIGVLTQIMANCMVAYVFSRREFMFRKLFTKMFIITMYFSGGLIPTYFLMRSLGLVGSFHVYWVPTLVAFYYIILMRTYMKGIPESLVESAYIDGANDWTVFIRIMMPLCIPLIATIGLFIAVGQWNNWFDTLIYNSNKPELTTLQYELMRKLNTVSLQASEVAAFEKTVSGSTGSMPIPKTISAAMTIIVVVPIIACYPFAQKYFIHGLMIGGIKE